jgi:uncharacterized protein YjeT (DUF2065 family)
MAPTTPPLAKEQKMKAASFYKYILGRTYILANLVLVLVGLGQLQVPLFFQNFTRTIQLPTKWPELPHHRPKNKNKGILLQKYILGRTYILANLVLVLVGLGQLQVPLFFQNFTRTIQLPTKWPELPHHWPKNRK